MTRGRAWQASFGAWLEGDEVRFRVWAPRARRLDVVIERPGFEPHPLERLPDDTFTGRVAGAAAGDRYRYRLDEAETLPDPASRFQPDGVHGASEIVDPHAFAWADAGWTGVPMERLLLYELHVGTFTPEGTFTAALERLPYLADLGVTAVELMPVADFAGSRNWGYDTAALFAPARCYGRPDDLRRLVDRAHALSLAVHLDVVYNHLGPDGASLPALSPQVFSDRHRSPWGAGINFDGPGSEAVRALFIENALHWIHEYHIDGLRLDATHAIVDESPRHFLAELAWRVKESAAAAGRSPVVVAEDSRNLAIIVERPERGGWGLDAVWADDFHHQIRRRLAGDAEGYYADFRGSAGDIAETVRRGWFFTGQASAHFGGPRGTDPSGIPLHRFVACIQNHDQVGNRAFGERLHHQVDPAAWRAASALLLCLPETPLLFMGQEWAASTPFLFFTEHHTELGRLVTEGRRREFQAFSAFADATARERIPDPQAPGTFATSRLVWEEQAAEPHAAMLRLYRRLMALRREVPALSGAGGGVDVRAPDEATVVLRRGAAVGPDIVLIVRVEGAGTAAVGPAASAWATLLTTEEPPFAADPAPPAIESGPGGVRIVFRRPGAVLLQEAG